MRVPGQIVQDVLLTRRGLDSPAIECPASQSLESARLLPRRGEGFTGLLDA